MFFDFFRKKKFNDKLEENQDLAIRAYASEPRVKENILSLCEQMTGFTKEMESVKQEYRLVTSYLNDIQIIEGLSAEEKEPILVSAREILKSNKAREEYMKLDKKLADVQFMQMKEQEMEIPGAIERLKRNEDFLGRVERDLKYLDGEKLHLMLRRKERERIQKSLRVLAILAAIVSIGVLVLIRLFSAQLGDLVNLVFLFALACICSIYVYIFVDYSNCSADIKRNYINRNYAITLENHAKIRYVHTKNAVDYVCEKYHVRNARELEYIFQCYQEAVREQQKFENANAELDYHNKELVKQLSALWLYDAKAWLNHVDALIDPREMVELKHKLVKRRQRIRGRLEEIQKSIEEIKAEVKEYLRQVGSEADEMQQLVNEMKKYGF